MAVTDALNFASEDSCADVNSRAHGTEFSRSLERFNLVNVMRSAEWKMLYD